MKTNDNATLEEVLEALDAGRKAWGWGRNSESWEEVSYHPGWEALVWVYESQGVRAGENVAIICNRRWRVELPEPEVEYVDVKPYLDEDGAWYVDTPCGSREYLDHAIAYDSCIGYVWEERGGETIYNVAIMYRDSNGALWYQWGEGRVKEICKAVRFRK